MGEEEGFRRDPDGRMGTPEAPAGFGAWDPTSAIRSPRRVEKPWGFELIWAEADEYLGKLLHVRAGESLSLQFHEEKDETLFLFSGELTLELGAGIGSLRRVEFLEGMSVRIPPGILHRMEAVTDCVLFEASTPGLDDVVRVRDRYGRVSDPSPEGP